MSVSLFFFSNYCQNCKQVMHEIKKSPVNLSIKYICIDSQAVRKKLPSYINSVPCLVVGNSNQIYTGNQILGWVKMKSIKQNSMNTNNNSKEMRQQINNSITQANREANGPDAWHNNEMNAFSDSYSFIGIDTSAEGNGGMSMIHNFETISSNSIESGNIRAPGGAPSKPAMPVNYNNPLSDSTYNSNFGSIQMSEKASQLDKAMTDMLNKRELDIPNMPARI